MLFSRSFSPSPYLLRVLLSTQSSLTTHGLSLPVLISTQPSLTKTWRMDLAIDPNTKRTHRPSIQCFSRSLSRLILPSTPSSFTKTARMDLVIHPKYEEDTSFSIQCFLSFHPMLFSHSSLTKTYRMDLVIDPYTKRARCPSIQCFLSPSNAFLTVFLSPSFSLPSLPSLRQCEWT